jgi:hypothetical protein
VAQGIGPEFKPQYRKKKVSVKNQIRSLMRNQSRAVQTQSIKYSFECQFEVVCVSQTGEPVLDLEPIEAEILCHGNIPGQGL